MKLKLYHGILLSLIALIFTIGLTFATIELPSLLDAFLHRTIDLPDVATGLNELSDYKTELYLQYFHLRLIGYCCLALILILIVVGFATEKAGWTAAGALVLFLPVFGHFAATMFFLGGLGFLRLLWLPLLDVSFKLFRIGAIINLPYDILAYFYSLLGLNPMPNLSYIITGIGLLIFFLGTLTWFYSRMQKRGVADFWIYRLSRHPQYLGWIVWSYGMLFLPGGKIRLCYELSTSLPWLFATMIIIGVAMLEELKMRRVHGEAFESYRKHAPFLFPLPRFAAKFFNLPLRLIFKKDYPERKREIVAVLSCYTLLSLGISVFYGGFVTLPARKAEASIQQIEGLTKVLKEADYFGEKRRAASELEKIGEPAMESLIALLSDRQPQVRAYAAETLGSMKSERIISPLIALLDDADSYIRRTTASALGRTGSEKAIQPLVGALQDPAGDVASAAARGLAKIKHPSVIPHLIEALGDSTLKVTGAIAGALGEMGAKEAIDPLVRCLEQMPDCPYDVVGVALWKLGSERAVDAWIMGLKKGSWWYPRAFCAAELGKNKLETGIPALQKAVQDSSVEVRRAAVLALMEFQSEQIIETLRGALEDEDFEVRMYAEEALKRIGMLETLNTIKK